MKPEPTVSGLPVPSPSIAIMMSLAFDVEIPETLGVEKSPDARAGTATFESKMFDWDTPVKPNASTLYACDAESFTVIVSLEREPVLYAYHSNTLCPPLFSELRWEYDRAAVSVTEFTFVPPDDELPEIATTIRSPAWHDGRVKVIVVPPPVWPKASQAESRPFDTPVTVKV